MTPTVAKYKAPPLDRLFTDRYCDEAIARGKAQQRAGYRRWWESRTPEQKAALNAKHREYRRQNKDKVREWSKRAHLKEKEKIQKALAFWEAHGCPQ